MALATGGLRCATCGGAAGPGWACPRCDPAPDRAAAPGPGGTWGVAPGEPGPAAAWFPDPGDQRLLRWWDGRDWTAHTAPRFPVAPAPSARGGSVWPWVVGGLAIIACFALVFVAVAVPVFLGAQERARERAAQSNLEMAFTASRVVFTENDGDVSSVTPEALLRIEPTLAFTTGPSRRLEEVSIAPGESRFMAAVLAAPGRCLALIADHSGVVHGEVVGGDCTAGEAASARFRPSPDGTYDSAD